MKLREIYELAIEMGMAHDPRGEKGVQKELDRQKRIYESLSGKQKEAFSQDLLANPYADSRILNGTGEEEINGLICGVDMETHRFGPFAPSRRCWFGRPQRCDAYAVADLRRGRCSH